MRTRWWYQGLRLHQAASPLPSPASGTQRGPCSRTNLISCREVPTTIHPALSVLASPWNVAAVPGEAEGSGRGQDTSPLRGPGLAPVHLTPSLGRASPCPCWMWPRRLGPGSYLVAAGLSVLPKDLRRVDSLAEGMRSRQTLPWGSPSTSSAQCSPVITGRLVPWLV